MLNKVIVKFEDEKYNYCTSVNQLSYEDLTKYFVGTFFNMGKYPIENFQKCVGIELIIKQKAIL